MRYAFNIIIFCGIFIFTESVAQPIDPEMLGRQAFGALFQTIPPLLLRHGERAAYCIKRGISDAKCQREYELRKKLQRDKRLPSLLPD